MKKTYLKASPPKRKRPLDKVPSSKRKVVSTGQISGNKKLSKGQKDKQLRNEWLIPKSYNHKLRYVGIRGIYWYWLSRDVRKKEWEKWNGECITCLVPLETWQEGQCGHILASAFCGEYLRLNRMNLTLQHAKCNNPRFSPHAGVANALNIDKRHGAGYMERLYSLRKTPAKNPSTSEYKTLIESLDSYQEAKNKALLEE